MNDDEIEVPVSELLIVLGLPLSTYFLGRLLFIFLYKVRGKEQNKIIVNLLPTILGFLLLELYLGFQIIEFIIVISGISIAGLMYWGIDVPPLRRKKHK